MWPQIHNLSLITSKSSIFTAILCCTEPNWSRASQFSVVGILCCAGIFLTTKRPIQRGTVMKYVQPYHLSFHLVSFFVPSPTRNTLHQSCLCRLPRPSLSTTITGLPSATQAWGGRISQLGLSDLLRIKFSMWFWDRSHGDSTPLIRDTVPSQLVTASHPSPSG